MMMDSDEDRDIVVERFLAENRFADAEGYALTLQEDWQRAESLASIARTAWKANEHERALRLWSLAEEAGKLGEGSDSNQDSLDASSVLWEIAENLATVGKVAAAKELARSIFSERKRENALKGVQSIEMGSTGSFEF